MKKRIVTLTIALIMLIGMQVFATTGLPLTPNKVLEQGQVQLQIQQHQEL